MLFSKVFLLVSSAVTVVTGLAFASPNPSCGVSKFEKNQFTNMTVLINDDPLVPLEAPAINGMNGTSWDYWYFDGTDETNPEAGLVIAFWRSAPIVGFGQAPLRVDLYASDGHGASITNESFFEESWIISCYDKTIGVWNSSDGTSVTFEVDAALKSALVTFDTEDIKGTYKIDSTADVRIPNNQPFGSKTAQAEMSPGFYWTEPIPYGNVTTDLTISGLPLSINGKGGHDRNWGSRLIPELADNWHFIRAWIGPYRFIYYQVTTGLWLSKNQTYSSAFLYDGDEIVFTSPAGPISGPLSNTNDYTSFGFSYNGPTAGSIVDNSTGYIIDLISPGRDLHWHFEVNHTAVVHQLPNNTVEMAAYLTNTGIGGLVGGEQFTGGVGFSQECEFLGAYPTAK